MSLFQRVRGLLRGSSNDALPTGVIQQEFGAAPAASQIMRDQQRLWYLMYTNQAPWLTRDVRPLGLPAAIGRELSRHALAEFSATIGGSRRGEFIHQQLLRASSSFGNNLELGLCLGGVAFKPFADHGRLLVESFSSGFVPTHFDGSGKAVGGVFKSAPLRQNDAWFVKLEFHDFLPLKDGCEVYVVENKAFRSGPDGRLGPQVPLREVSAWSDLCERSLIEGLDAPLFAYFIPPMANQEDPSSKLGVSVYSGAVIDLIRQADEQWERIWWEFKSGERKIFSDALQVDPAQLDDRLFLSGAFTRSGDLFQQFSPDFRSHDLYLGLQYILKLIEFNTGLAFGTISDPQAVSKTATEVLAAKQRQFVTEGAIQRAFQSAVDDLVFAMDAWCDLLDLAPAGKLDVSYHWGDGVLDDPEARRLDLQLDIQRVQAGLMEKNKFLEKWEK